jgi:hypothetical protein
MLYGANYDCPRGRRSNPLMNPSKESAESPFSTLFLPFNATPDTTGSAFPMPHPLNLVSRTHFHYAPQHAGTHGSQGRKGLLCDVDRHSDTVLPPRRGHLHDLGTRTRSPSRLVQGDDLCTRGAGHRDGRARIGDLVPRHRTRDGGRDGEGASVVVVVMMVVAVAAGVQRARRCRRELRWRLDIVLIGMQWRGESTSIEGIWGQVDIRWSGERA